MANKNWLCFLIYPIILCTNLTINYIDIIRLIIERTCLKIVRARKICAPFTATHLSILTMPYVFNSCSFNYNIHYILLQ